MLLLLFNCKVAVVETRQRKWYACIIRKDGKMGKRRYFVLDNIRGITLISMILYHTMWDMRYMFGVKVPGFQWDLAYIWQQSICWTFIFLSGFCWHFSKKKMQRGLFILGAGGIVTLVTLLLLPDSRIIYGVLTFLGISTLLMILLQPLCEKGNPLAGAIVTAVLFFLFRNVNAGNLGFETIKVVSLPRAWYANMVTTLAGFPMKGFFSTDYFSILPWFFLFQTGYFAGNLVEKYGKMPCLQGKKIPLVTWLGQHSVWVYLFHQPVIYGLGQLCF